MPADELTYEEGRELLDAAARRKLGMSGDEFLAAWDAGTLDVDGPDHVAIVHVSGLIPFARLSLYAQARLEADNAPRFKRDRSRIFPRLG